MRESENVNKVGARGTGLALDPRLTTHSTHGPISKVAVLQHILPSEHVNEGDAVFGEQEWLPPNRRR